MFFDKSLAAQVTKLETKLLLLKVDHSNVMIELGKSIIKLQDDLRETISQTNARFDVFLGEQKASEDRYAKVDAKTDAWNKESEARQKQHMHVVEQYLKRFNEIIAKERS